jgi:DNA ligase (NAD+)
MDTIQDIVNKLLKAKEDYYNSEPSMTDEEFDNLEDELRSLDSENVYFSIVGTNIKGSNKIKHSTPMLSCGKAKTVPEVLDWLKKLGITKEELIIMPKIDGLSASIKYVNGSISYISTRGDGKIGQDITHLKESLNIPKLLSNISCEVRGEIYLPKDTTLETNGKPLRNIAAGIVNRKGISEEANNLHFITYYLDYKENRLFSDDLKTLYDFGFEVVNYTILDSNEKDLQTFYDQYLSIKREEFNFETDGLVIQVNNKELYNEIDSKYTIDHHHYYNIALKPTPKGMETILREIDWDVSKQGNIIPVAIFDPVVIGSSTISRATLNNFENIEKNDIRIGSILYIELANEIIPYLNRVVKKNIESDKIIMTKCPSCGSILVRNGVHLQCRNVNCRDKNIKLITSYCQACEMDGVSSSTIATLYDYGFIQSVKDLYSLSQKKTTLRALDGFGPTKIKNLIEQIEKSRNQTIVQFIARLGIDSVGERAVSNAGIKTRDDFFNLRSSNKVVVNSIVKFRDENYEYIKELMTMINPTDIIEKTSKGKVAMTGSGPKGRKELINDLEAMGYEYTESINKDCSFLLCEDPNSGSSKLVKASKIGIKLMKYSEFFKK